MEPFRTRRTASGCVRASTRQRSTSRTTRFIDLGVGTPGVVWAIRQNGTGTADAEMNWWGTTDPGVIATMIGEGAADYDPYWVSFVLDPAKAGAIRLLAARTLHD